MSLRFLIGLALVLPALAAEVPTVSGAAEHPFLLWTKAEAATIRRRIETDPWAKAQYETMLKEKGNGHHLPPPSCLSPA